MIEKQMIEKQMIEKQKEEIKSDVFFFSQEGSRSQLLDCFLQSVWHPLTGVSNEGARRIHCQRSFKL